MNLDDWTIQLLSWHGVQGLPIDGGCSKYTSLSSLEGSSPQNSRRTSCSRLCNLPQREELLQFKHAVRGYQSRHLSNAA
jgi:hypothetical protein